MMLFLINYYCVFMKVYLVFMCIASRLQNSTSVSVLALYTTITLFVCACYRISTCIIFYFVGYMTKVVVTINELFTVNVVFGVDF